MHNVSSSPSCLNEVKQSLANSTTRSDHGHSLSVVLVDLRMRGIPLALAGRVYLSVWREEGALCVESLAVFVPSCPHPLFSTVYQCDGSLSSRGRGGFMARLLSGFASHRCSLCLGAGCQQWKLQDVLGTQPPHGDVLFKGGIHWITNPLYSNYPMNSALYPFNN